MTHAETLERIRDLQARVRELTTAGQRHTRVQGDPASQLHERHAASDFDTQTQDKIGEPAKTA